MAQIRRQRVTYDGQGDVHVYSAFYPSGAGKSSTSLLAGVKVGCARLSKIVWPRIYYYTQFWYGLPWRTYLALTFLIKPQQ